MNKLLSSIESSINNTVNEYNLLISDKFNIDIEELKNIWTNTFEGVMKQSKKSSSKNVSEKSSVNGGDDEIKCVYKFIKGKQQGESCNKSTKNGTRFCSKHSKFEEDGQKEKHKLPKVESKSPDRIIKLNKELNKWWHKESKLVFKSSKDKVVIGTYKNNEYKPISKDDISECEKYGFKYELEEKELPVKSVEKKKEIPVKAVEKKKEIPIKEVEKKSLVEEINTTNMYAKNVEDIITDMMKDSDDSEEELQELEEELEEELDEE